MPELADSMLQDLDKFESSLSLLDIRPYHFTAIARSETQDPWVGSVGTHVVAQSRTDDSFACHFHGEIRQGSEDQPSVKLVLSLELTYKLPNLGTWDDELLHQYAATRVPHQSWPYWREYVQSTGARLQIAVPVVGISYP